MTAHGLTARQAEALAIVRRHLDDEGLAPSYRELCAEMGLRSASQAAALVVALERRGHITRLPRFGRSIRLTEQAARHGSPRAQAAPSETPAAPGRVVEKRCATPDCRQLYLTPYAHQQRCWNCQTRAIYQAQPTFRLTGAR